MGKVFKLDQEEAHFNRIDTYARKIEQLYLEVVQEAASISSSVKLPDGKMFSFDGFPNAKSKVDKLMSSLSDRMTYYINEATGKEWYEASANKKKLIEEFAATTNLTKSQLESYNSRNLEALKAFQNRKVNGLGLSEKVWSYTNQFKGELEMGLDLGIGEGKSAAELSRDLRSYLNDPNKLFRRVRDKHGNLQLSKNAAKYNPGSGQYRSSYKNAMRLTRTEINMAYRESDYLKNQQLDFVVGFKVVRSNHHFDCSVCESLKGDYPKTFKFVGWHPHCRCHVEDILASEDEFIKHQKNILDGKRTSLKSENEVKDLPEGFKGWIADNEERITQAKQNGTLPYFLRDNKVPQFTVDKRDYVSLSKSYADSFSQTATRIAEEFGCIVTPTSIKTETRIFEKAASDYGGDVAQVLDIIRNTMIVDSSKMESVIASIEKEFEVFRTKIQSANVDKMGYSGMIINVKTSPTTFAEIQLNTPQIIYGKSKSCQKLIGDDLFYKIMNESGLEHGLGHKWYEEWRKLDFATDAERMNKLEDMSKNYYEKLRNIQL
jgi:hypothetical protein